jgi:hypothetical protein
MRRIALLLLLATAACDRPPQPSNATIVVSEDKAPTPANAQDDPGRDGVGTERTDIPELDGVPLAEGRWSIVDGKEARFGLAGDPAFTIRCDPDAGMIVLTRGQVSGNALQIITDRGANRFDAQGDGNQTIARFPVKFPWFKDVLAKAEGTFGVRIDDGEPLALPIDPAIAQVIAVCR